MQWCVETDTFTFNIGIKPRQPTRRGILSIVSSVFDPLGFTAPFVLFTKQILQDFCRIKLGWDDEIPPEHLSTWVKWFDDHPKLSSFSVNRCDVTRRFWSCGLQSTSSFLRCLRSCIWLSFLSTNNKRRGESTLCIPICEVAPCPIEIHLYFSFRAVSCNDFHPR